jgi:magnesium-transporting ATPase (P-type)
VGYAPEGDITVANAAGDGPGEALGEGGAAVLKAILEGALLANDSALTKGTDEATGKVVYSPLGAPTEVALLTAGQKVRARAREPDLPAGRPCAACANLQALQRMRPTPTHPPQAGIDLPALKAAKPRAAVIPFESEHKFMASVNEEDGGKRTLYVKGASDRLLPLCKTQYAADDLTKTAPVDLGFWHKAQSELSSQGLRVLALCKAELPKGEPLEGLTADTLQKRTPFLTMVCFFAILDPPRTEVVAAIKESHAAGITGAPQTVLPPYCGRAPRQQYPCCRARSAAPAACDRPHAPPLPPPFCAPQSR